MDKKNDKNKTYVILLVLCGVLILIIGLAVIVLGGNNKPEQSSQIPPNTSLVQTIAEQPGALSIEPLQIQMQPDASGKMSGVATVSALYRDFTVSQIQLLGHPQLAWKSDCMKAGDQIPAGQRCQITIEINENVVAPANPDNSLAPTISIVGNSSSPGGTVLPVEARANILVDNVNFASGPPIDATGAIAPAGIDPYGSPPINYNQDPVAPAQPTLTPREQFILARRQAVFNGMSPRTNATPQQKSTGGWDELNIPSSTSSLPQNMSRVVTMDRIITAALVRPYDSRASQQVIAQVDRNVYSAHGRNILIPRGSTLIGTASGGGERVAINWTQLMRPDGARFVIQASTGDAMGQAGVPGKINERIMKRYGSILLGTALNVGTAKVFDAEEEAGGGDNAQPARNNGAIISDIVRQDIQKITNDIVQRNLQRIQPIITVPAGTRITVIPTMDLVLRPMTRKEVQADRYPRTQNAGAPVPGYGVPVAAGNTNNAPGNYNTPTYDLSTPPSAPVQPVSLPPINPPATGSTPPWDAN